MRVVPKRFVRADESRVYVLDAANDAILVVDVATASHVNTIVLPGEPSASSSVAVGRNGLAADKAYVALDTEIAIVDLVTEQVTGTIVLAPLPVHDLELSDDGESLVYSHGTAILKIGQPAES